MNQNDLVLGYLETGAKLTPLEALRRFGIMRLGARIYDLKQAGHEIKSEKIKTRSGKHVCQYSL